MPNPGSDRRDERPGLVSRAPARPPGGAERISSSGRTIAGRYRLDRVLGKGSMGTVWAAYDETLHRRVAIKEIYFPDGTPENEAAMLVERTLREARAIAQLSHPNVITLYDILTLNTGPVIVMEVLAARSLGEVLKEVGPLTIGQAATVGLAVAAGLSAAHAAGITHRDVKPGNVLIGGDGRIKLTDFGIARSAAENPMTATGLLLGSPAYIAPEVASGATAGPPADAWGLGALLFACVEGGPPFDKGSPIATLMSVVNDPIPTVHHAGPITPVIKGLLVKDPAHRLNLRQARGALRPLADDPVETRLVFRGAPTGAAGSERTGGRASSPTRAEPSQPGRAQQDNPRPDTGHPEIARPGAGQPDAGRPAPTGPEVVRQDSGGTPRPADFRPGPPPTQAMPYPTAGSSRPPIPAPPPWFDKAPPRTPAVTQSSAAQSNLAGSNLTRSNLARGAVPRPAPIGAAMPAPPWGTAGAPTLAALPAAAPPPASVGVTASPNTRRWIAIVIFLAAAVLAFFGIRAIAETVNSDAVTTASRSASPHWAAGDVGGLSAG